MQRLFRSPHRTLLNKHFRTEGRKTFYKSIEQMQKELNAYLVSYNTRRPHQGRGMKGRTPIQAFTDGLKLMPKPDLSQQKKEEKMNPKRQPDQIALRQRLSAGYRVCTI